MRTGVFVLAGLATLGAGCGQFNGEVLARNWRNPAPAKASAPAAASTRQVTLDVSGMT